jgi:predicted nucleotidyltransferase
MDYLQILLKELEAKHDIDILYACEAGSRAWGFASSDSDFDFRFVYKQKRKKKYLSLHEPKDTIDGFSDDRLYDWQGWDIKKALKLLCQSNPSLLEWLYSPIVYYSDGKLANDAKALVEKSRQLKPLLHHYKSMAKGNFMKHINNKTDVSGKKYLYVIRPAAMVVWLLNKKNTKSFIEIDFNKVLEDIKGVIGDEIFSEILKLIEAKKQRTEHDSCKRIECVDKWLSGIIDSKEDFPNDANEKIDFKDCDELMFNYLS